ncbi:thiamine ABC transporter ATP-binding protein [Agrobacterium rubi TR3 = NBRC 13261]|uniref:Thiamine ABC transporter ATP-binding protein n=1 Tax=Agrobacterium rubi TR3 = NBRC 13261 TaxID=1368415 RepID=A0A081CXG7_9HYPH|nr:ATP-binding cassette domain-containing protein [Agrobacterium rubi]MBP1879703.1 thiamine transport system ATP-binding protein [Agrobacterium rubi]MCL6654483.1 thiamine ABC transporter ATP-binding protein [Agrobacterium rubi]GAK71363.1 thiamine ABC transporter ATP-binding protein [Agrobacterium rubi TR3 = NBRC 13261]
MSAQEWSVRLDNVTLTLGHQEFLLDCGFERGKVTAVVGPSGSGKSTLLNLVAGFEAPDAGRVLIDGHDMRGLDPSQRPVSLIFQDNNLFSHLDIVTNVGLGVSPSLRLSSEDKARISQALERVGLGGFEKRMPSTMSGGERQRAALARALVRQRAVMLLDEPFAALDPGLRSGMAALLKQLHADMQNTVLLVTHQPDDIRRLADAVIFLSDGRVLYKGSVEDFFAATHIDAISTFLSG